ncbi:MAG: SDR family NAD(P)-dependent oxidoreductase [Chloroflexi bacterium]|nr:MAG: SDR family NAD(P)-dependent oxidoreductase [Chloroflexota bacterium]
MGPTRTIPQTTPQTKGIAGPPAGAPYPSNMASHDSSAAPLAGRTLLVTGASSGTGLAGVLAWHRLGAEILVGSRSAASCADVADRMGNVRVHPFVADLGDPAGIDVAIDNLEGSGNTPTDILHFAAGGLEPILRPLLRLTAGLRRIAPSQGRDQALVDGRAEMERLVAAPRANHARRRPDHPLRERLVGNGGRRLPGLLQLGGRQQDAPRAVARHRGEAVGAQEDRRHRRGGARHKRHEHGKADRPEHRATDDAGRPVRLSGRLCDHGGDHQRGDPASAGTARPDRDSAPGLPGGVRRAHRRHRSRGSGGGVTGPPVGGREEAAATPRRPGAHPIPPAPWRVAGRGPATRLRGCAAKR